jgi:pyruvate formate lyase activating enzyme
MSVTGFITNFQDYAVHDGFGLRVILFLKGCSLRCTWCQNPESISDELELYYHEKLCKNCGKCIEACEVKALKDDIQNRVDRSKCTKCMKCVDVCPRGALARVGNRITSDEVLKIFLDYKVFFDASDNGGITLSGGDPVCQPEFAIDVLQKCHAAGIHTAMETAGYTEYSTLARIVEHLDLLLFDLKHMDSAVHRKGTGVANELIHENLIRLRKDFPDLEIIIRIPLIPGFNDDEENVSATAKFLAEIGINKLDILPFNILASAKYNALGRKWKHAGVERQEDEYLARLKECAQKYIADMTIGGLR